MSAFIFQATAFEDGGAYVMGRIVGNAGTNITIASLTRIDYSVVDFFAGTTIVALTQLTPVSSYVFDTLQTDARWTEDTTGYNFAHWLAATTLPQPNRRYIVSYKFTPGTGEVFWFRPEIYTVKAYP